MLADGVGTHLGGLQFELPLAVTVEIILDYEKVSVEAPVTKGEIFCFLHVISCSFSVKLFPKNVSCGLGLWDLFLKCS